MSILLRQTGHALPMATSLSVQEVQNLACPQGTNATGGLSLSWPVTHHAGPFINLVRQNPVLQIQRPPMDLDQI